MTPAKYVVHGFKCWHPAKTRVQLITYYTPLHFWVVQLLSLWISNALSWWIMTLKRSVASSDLLGVVYNPMFDCQFRNRKQFQEIPPVNIEPSEPLVIVFPDLLYDITFTDQGLQFKVSHSPIISFPILIFFLFPILSMASYAHLLSTPNLLGCFSTPLPFVKLI